MASDLEMTKLCAEAMGWSIDPETDSRCRVRDADGAVIHGIGEGWIVQRYDPLHDDAQAMALVKKFRLRTMYNSIGGWWTVKDDIHNDGSPSMGVQNTDLNRAIVKCVAKMQAKGGPDERTE